ncbi:MAG: deaminase [Candidatus Micrarchaeota archaeon]
MIIGLTGENCAGKDTIAQYLQKKGFEYLSLSDVIRDALADDGKSITRESLIAKGNELRAQGGSNVLAARTVAAMQPGKHYVVVSIRNPSEVEELRKQPNFKLVHVKAEPRIRFERMKARRREGDPHTLEAFMHIETAEAQNIDPSKQQMHAVVQMADRVVENNQDFPRLYEAMDRALADLSADFMPARPSWDEYFMGIAKVVAGRSNCMKRQVGAIIIRDKRIVSTGYNGTPRGVRNCNEGGCKRCNSFADSGTKLDECVCSHAEENAIVQAAYHGIAIRGGTLYTTFSPCLTCTKMILNAGLVEVVYSDAYPLGETPMRLLSEAGVLLRHIKI